MKHKTNALAVLLATAILSTLSPSQLHTAHANQAFSGGTGTKSNPYKISSIKDLKNIDKYKKAYYKLTKDLDFKGKSFESIGSMKLTDFETMANSFAGVFDGKGHTISNVVCKSSKGEFANGLFEGVTGTVKNLKVKNITCKNGSMCTGGIVGCNFGTLSGLSISGTNTIVGTNCIGGIAGGNNFGTIKNCKVSGKTTIKVTGNNDFSSGQIIQKDVAECGGLIVGGGFGGTVTNCNATGTVKAVGNEPVGLGGIGGCLQCMNQISGNTVKVKIIAKNGHAIGGLCGYAGVGDDGTGKEQAPSEIINNKINVDIDAFGATHVGGIVGTGLYYYGMEDRFHISNCTVNGTIDGATTPGTVAGRATACIIENITANVTIDGSKSEAYVGKSSKYYQSADQYEEGSSVFSKHLLENLEGDYTPLFDTILSSNYDNLWETKVKSLVPAEQVETSLQLLKGFCNAKDYGEAALQSNQQNFFCGFTNDIAKFSFNGSTISGIDKDGKQVFSYEYEFLSFENGYYQYKAKAENAGEFTYFKILPDLPGTTAHIEFIYGSDLSELNQNMTGGKYYHWLAAGIPTVSTDEFAKTAIHIFCYENLSQSK